MKATYLILFALLITFCCCTKDDDNTISAVEKIRYKDEVFTNVQEANNIKYGEALKFDQSGNEDLFLDLYQPEGDDAPSRPLIICVHGGAFNTGDKQQDNWPLICEAFAKRGYVAASINYRLKKDSADVFEPAYRAQQDLRAAVRFARRYATQYRIDTNKIYAMGGSAGGVTCLNVAYKNNQSDVPASINQTIWGDLEGNSGNSGFSSSISGVVSLWGNISDTLTINTGDVPVGLMHSVNDQTSPYYYENDPQTGSTFGSFYINKRAINVGIKTDLYTYTYNGHGDGLYPPYLDTTIQFSTIFLYELVD